MTSKVTNIPEGNSDEAVEFLEKMFPGQRRHLVAIPIKGRLEASTFLASGDEDMRSWIEARQRKANLYFHVNGLRPGVSNKKASKDDVSTALFVHVDIDDPNAEERLLGFSPPPTVVVSSGGGYHSYWKLMLARASYCFCWKGRHLPDTRRSHELTSDTLPRAASVAACSLI